MTCPDWTLLAAHRLADSPAAADPEAAGAWSEALAHLDGCPECRHRAVAADPTLLFRSLPAWEPEPAEVDAMRAGVAALRRAHRVAPRADRPLEAGPRSRRSVPRETSGWRVAAAAGLAAALLAVAPVAERSPSDPARPPATAARFAAGVGVSVAAFLDDPSLPAVDDIENPTASVYHFDDEEVAVVMVVDAGLDV